MSELEDLRAEVERLRSGESDDRRPENAWPTPGQFILDWNEMVPEMRLKTAQNLVDAMRNEERLSRRVGDLRAEVARHFDLMVKEAARAEVAEAKVAAVKALADDLIRARWLFDDDRDAALRGLGNRLRALASVGGTE